MAKTKTRCKWVTDDPLYIDYHDREWGVPVHDDDRLFEMLVLEGAQAGLAWITVLRKREAYRKAFRGFDPRRVARMRAADVRRLMSNAGLIRNKAKITSAIDNAKAVLEVQEEHGSLDAFLWSFVDGKQVVNRYRTQSRVPSESARSRAMSKELRQRGFRFVGPTICYAFMEAVGMLDDHVVGCFRHGKGAAPTVRNAIRERRP